MAQAPSRPRVSTIIKRRAREARHARDPHDQHDQHDQRGASLARNDPQVSARAAGLRYVSDQTPGIRRESKGHASIYFAADGSAITNSAELRRIAALAIPPAWTHVWICPNPRGHIQATGKDARRRKQYRYHPGWQEIRAETKYHRMIAFGEALPQLRACVQRDLTRPGLPYEKVIAAIVRLLDATALRIGNEEYARANGSYGLTTLRDQHVQIDGTTIRVRFRGKRGKTHQLSLRDRRVARVVRQLEDLPGQQLFEYQDDGGDVHAIESSDVNDYLRAISGGAFSAKDFRTWAATVMVAQALRCAGPAATKAAIRSNEKAAIAEAAKHLGNTLTICKTSYVHPAVLAGYEDGTLCSPHSAGEPAAHSGLPPNEAETLAFLREAERCQAAPGARAG